MKDAKSDAAALLHALKLLEANPELAKDMADAVRTFAEEVLTVDTVHR